MAAEPKRRLGRGLDALLRAYPEPQETSDAAPVADSARRKVPVELIERNPRNPRRDFRKEDLDELAASLKQHGVVQPIVVRRIEGGDERYEIIAGERRWRAAQLAGMHEVPVTVLDVTDRQALELAIVENVQRADLNPVEEARGYQALIAEFDYSQGDLGDVIGKSRVHVTNTLRLLKLPEAVLHMVQTGALTAGHGRALLGAKEPLKLAQLIITKNLSVRDAERLALEPTATTQRAPKRKKGKSADVTALEKELTDRIGMKVEIVEAGEGRGEVQILFRSLEQLDLICRRLRSEGGGLNGERKSRSL